MLSFPLPSRERVARTVGSEPGKGAVMKNTPGASGARRPLPQGKREKWPDIAGRIEGETHVLPVRVYFEDTDCAGVVYHSNFLKFCERGRSDFIRLLGLDHQGLANPEAGEPAVFVVRRVEIDYLKPGPWMICSRLSPAAPRSAARASSFSRMSGGTTRSLSAPA